MGDIPKNVCQNVDFMPKKRQKNTEMPFPPWSRIFEFESARYVLIDNSIPQILNERIFELGLQKFLAEFSQNFCRNSAKNFAHKIHSELKIAESMEFGGTYRLNLVLLKNIDIWSSYRPKDRQNINYSIFGHTIFGHNSAIFRPIGLKDYYLSINGR